jgi:hypothetical protein
MLHSEKSRKAVIFKNLLEEKRVDFVVIETDTKISSSKNIIHSYNWKLYVLAASECEKLLQLYHIINVNGDYCNKVQWCIQHVTLWPQSGPQPNCKSMCKSDLRSMQNT